MERETWSDKMERLANDEEKDYIRRLLGAQGLYDASQDIEQDNIIRGEK